MGRQVQVGDVVELKSGGPNMTVQSIEQMTYHKVVGVSWFDELGQISNAWFHIDAVKIKILGGQ
jgi:uncharacterized protein YodC (DUF2158 family)